jgi:uncharacterized membrane protein YccC
MPDDFPDLRKILDTTPAVEPRPVDLARLYRDALDRQARVARRWKRAAIGVAALAASVLAVVLLPKLELRANGHEFAVRWGTPPEAEVTPDPRVQQLLDEQAKQLAAIRATNAKHTDLQDLLLTLAADVDQRDKEQQQKLLTLAKRLGEFETLTARQFQDTEKTNTALYNVVFNSKPKEVNP